MRAWSIGILAGGVLAYGVMEAQTPAKTTWSQGAAKTASAGQAAKGSGAPGNVTQARVLAEAGRGDNWLVNGGTFESQHFSLRRALRTRTSGGWAWLGRSTSTVRWVFRRNRSS
jgi:hypothetical protein